MFFIGIQCRLVVGNGLQAITNVCLSVCQSVCRQCRI